MSSLFVVSALAIIAASLWIRRITWHCQWEVAITLSIALQGIALLLCLPIGSMTVSLWLFRVNGEHNLAAYIGHDLWLIAATLIAGHCLSVPLDDERFRRDFYRYVELPVTLVIPILLAAYTMSDASEKHIIDLFKAPSDNWLRFYWTTLCLAVIWMLGYAARALHQARRDPDYQVTANIYYVSCVVGITACCWRILVSYHPGLHHLFDGTAVWVLATITGAGFAWGAARSWRIRTRLMLPDPSPLDGPVNA